MKYFLILSVLIAFVLQSCCKKEISPSLEGVWYNLHDDLYKELHINDSAIFEGDISVMGIFYHYTITEDTITFYDEFNARKYPLEIIDDQNFKILVDNVWKNYRRLYYVKSYHSIDEDNDKEYDEFSYLLKLRSQYHKAIFEVSPQ